MNYQFVSTDSIPTQAKTRTKWQELRTLVLSELDTDGQAACIIFPNKQTAQAAQSAAQNCRKVFRKANQATKIHTCTRPVKDRGGKWRFWVWLTSH